MGCVSSENGCIQYIYISIHCNRVDLAGSCILYSPRKQSSQDCRDSTYEDDSANFVGQSNSILRQDTHHYGKSIICRSLSSGWFIGFPNLYSSRNAMPPYLAMSKLVGVYCEYPYTYMYIYVHYIYIYTFIYLYIHTYISREIYSLMVLCLWTNLQFLEHQNGDGGFKNGEPQHHPNLFFLSKGNQMV